MKMVSNNNAPRAYFFKRLISSKWVNGELIYIMKNGTDLGRAMLIVQEILVSDKVSLPEGGTLTYENGMQRARIPAFKEENNLELALRRKVDIENALEDFKKFWEDPATLAQFNSDRIISFEILPVLDPNEVLEHIYLYLKDFATLGESFTIQFNMKGGGFLGSLEFAPD
jgi:hypothetical protein